MICNNFRKFSKIPSNIYVDSNVIISGVVLFWISRHIYVASVSYDVMKPADLDVTVNMGSSVS